MTCYQHFQTKVLICICWLFLSHDTNKHCPHTKQLKTIEAIINSDSANTGCGPMWVTNVQQQTGAMFYLWHWHKRTNDLQWSHVTSSVDNVSNYGGNKTYLVHALRLQFFSNFSPLSVWGQFCGMLPSSVSLVLMTIYCTACLSLTFPPKQQEIDTVFKICDWLFSKQLQLLLTYPTPKKNIPL